MKTKLNLIISTALLLAFPSIASASQLGTSISPAVITINARDSQQSADIFVENKTSQKVSYSILLVPFTSSGGNGEPILQKTIDRDYSNLFKNVVILDGNAPTTIITLAPQQKKTLKLVINLPNDLKKRDYYFSIIFTSNASEKIENSASVSIRQALGVNVLLSLGKNAQTQGEIKEFSTSNFVASEPVNFKLNVANQSQNFTTVTGNINIKNMFGQTIGSFDIEKTNILGNSERTIPAAWNEKLLLGKYTAKVEVSLSPQGPVVTNEATFIAFPYEYLILGLFLLLILYYLRSRMTSRSSSSN